MIQSVCCRACRERNNQPSTGAVKVMDGREKRVTTAAGEGWRQATATGDGGWRRKCRQSATRVAGVEEGDGGKSDGDRKKGGGRATATATATKRAMVRAARVADKEGYVKGGKSDGDSAGDGSDEDDGDGDGNGDGNDDGDGNGNGEGEGVESDGDGEEEGKGDGNGDN